MDCELDSHFVGLLEQKLENVRCARVDSDSASRLIPKEEEVKPEMSEEDSKALSDMVKAVLPQGPEYQVEAVNLGADQAPILITQNEFMRRYREMSSIGGGMNFYGSMPQMYDIKVNMENPIMAKIWAERAAGAGEAAGEGAGEGADAAEGAAGAGELLHQVVDLALLANGLLTGKALADFITRSQQLLG